ncbi:MAG: hypothetical protein ACLTUP_12100, partial [Anaerotignum sp.]|uniref:hypothetical protein n=1 Tax=Anaerotignum sp. TaxID=2039241 RepID=UPI0039966F4A
AVAIPLKKSRKRKTNVFLRGSCFVHFVLFLRRFCKRKTERNLRFSLFVFCVGNAIIKWLILQLNYLLPAAL